MSAGDRIRCPRCQTVHALEVVDAVGQAAQLLWFRCNGALKLGAVAGFPAVGVRLAA